MLGLGVVIGSYVPDGSCLDKPDPHGQPFAGLVGLLGGMAMLSLTLSYILFTALTGESPSLLSKRVIPGRMAVQTEDDFAVFLWFPRSQMGEPLLQVGRRCFQ